MTYWDWLRHKKEAEEAIEKFRRMLQERQKRERERAFLVQKSIHDPWMGM